MADATTTTTTNDPVADLELGGEGSPNAKHDPSAESALDAALRAEGFNPDGSEYEAPPAAPAAAPVIPAKKDDEQPAAPAATKIDDAVAPPKVDDAAPVVPKDDLDSVELPPHTKPKTAESFFKLKELARTRVAAIEKEREELKTKLAAAEETAKNGLPKESAKELEELRAFRQKVDVEADPEFKKFDSSATQNVESIYSKLKTAGFDDAAIKRVQELGGPDKVDWDKLAADGKIAPSLKRYIEAKLIENEDLTEKKKVAIEKAKANASEYLKGREKEIAKSDDAIVTETNKEWSTEIMPKVEWLALTKIDDKMKPDEKALAESHNKLVESVQVDINEAIRDNSPRMKALMIAGYITGRKFRFEFERLKSGTDAKIAALTKDLADKTAMLDRIKKSSPGRTNSSAPATTPAKKVTAASHINTDRGDHLDALLAEAQRAEAEKEV